MCLIEDKQRSLRRVFTAKHFPHNIITLRTIRGILYPRLHLLTFTTCTHAKIHSHRAYKRVEPSVSKLPLSSPPSKSTFILTHTVGRRVAETSFNYRRTLERDCSFGPICWKLPTVILFFFKVRPIHTHSLTHTHQWSGLREREGQTQQTALGKKDRGRVLDCRLTWQLVCADSEESILMGGGWGGRVGRSGLLGATWLTVAVMEDTIGPGLFCQE